MRNTHSATVPPLERAIERARAEFIEMPGLRLTSEQARRLWQLDTTLCGAVLDRLLQARFLRRVAGEAYVRNND